MRTYAVSGSYAFNISPSFVMVASENDITLLASSVAFLDPAAKARRAVTDTLAIDIAVIERLFSCKENNESYSVDANV